MMHLSRISQVEDLQPLKETWNELADGNPCLSWDWLVSWWGQYGVENVLYVMVARSDQGEVVGIAPWYLDQGQPLSKTIRFLGSGHVCSDLMTIMTHKGAEQEVCQSIANWMQAHANHREHSWDFISLDGVQDDDVAVTCLIQSFEGDGNVTHRLETEGYWQIELPSEIESYIKPLSRKSRSEVRKLIRNKIETKQAVLKEATDEATFQQAMEIFVDLHQKRRNSLAEPGCFFEEQFSEFVFDVGRRLMKRGELQLVWAELHGVPVAVHFNLIQGDRVFCYQTGFDPAFHKDKPGRLISVLVFLKNIEQGVKTFDLMRGDEGYKARWGAKKTEMAEWRIVSKKWCPRISHQLWATRQSVKQWVKSKWMTSNSS